MKEISMILRILFTTLAIFCSTPAFPQSLSESTSDQDSARLCEDLLRKTSAEAGHSKAEQLTRLWSKQAQQLSDHTLEIEVACFRSAVVTSRACSSMVTQKGIPPLCSALGRIFNVREQLLQRELSRRDQKRLEVALEKLQEAQDLVKNR
jgi:hypothetical protein